MLFGVKKRMVSSVVAVAVEVDARAGRVGALGTRCCSHRSVVDAAAVGEHILEARIDRQEQAVRQREARLAADVAGVRGVDPDAEVVDAARR